MTLPSFSASASTLPQLTTNTSAIASANQSANDLNFTPTLIPPSRPPTINTKTTPTIFDNTVPLARSSPVPQHKPAPPPRSTTELSTHPISSVCLYSLFLQNFPNLLYISKLSKTFPNPHDLIAYFNIKPLANLYHHILGQQIGRTKSY